MQIHITPLTEDLLAAARAFNARVRSAAPFLLPETVPARQSAAGQAPQAITWTHYLALDDAAVRGGFLLMDQPAWIHGEVRRASNSQSLLSEGIRDRKYGVVSVHMLKYIEQRAPYAFMVGMGDAQQPLPRLLQGAGWTLRPVPFFFRVCHVRNFLREMRVFRQKSLWRMAAGAASVSGAGWMGIRLLQARPGAGRRRGQVERVTSWGPWAGEIWQQYRAACSFAVVRDRSTLDLLYPLDERVSAGVIRQGATLIGWAAWLITAMRDDQHFGNLRVATILDCVAAPESAGVCASSITRHLEQSGADLVITNQAHSLWQAAFRRAGFLSAASNYLLATSKELTAAIAAGGGEQRVHLTRGDGDGRIHL
jgi:hypothetical protein